MSSDSAKPEGASNPNLDSQAPLWQWMGKPQPRREPVVQSERSNRLPELIARASAEQREKPVAQPATTDDYVILDWLRIACLFVACIAPVAGLIALTSTGNGYLFVFGLVSALPLMLAAAWLGLAIDIARHTKQAAGELRELRILLAQRESTATPERTKT
jgi:hypothetical protein